MRAVPRSEHKRHGCTLCFDREKLVKELKEKYHVKRKRDMPGVISTKTWCPFDDGCPYRDILDKYPSYAQFNEKMSINDKLLFSDIIFKRKKDDDDV